MKEQSLYALTFTRRYSKISNSSHHIGERKVPNFFRAELHSQHETILCLSYYSTWAYLFTYNGADTEPFLRDTPIRRPLQKH